jgi:ubiquinone/menaquinone biosynthesis C-methylase UbiE
MSGTAVPAASGWRSRAAHVMRLAATPLRLAAWSLAGALLRVARPLGSTAVAGDSLAKARLQQQVARELVRTRGWAGLLDAQEIEQLARELAASDALARCTAAQRAAILPRVVAADPSLFQRWPDLDEVLNFSWRMRGEWLKRQASEIPAGARVLDAGAGEGQYRPLFAHTHYQAQDFAQYEGSADAAAPENWTYHKLDYVCDITAIPVAGNSFDVVVCTEVMEHVPDPLAALRELARVTAPGGRLLLTAPLGSGMHQEPYHFYGGFSRHFWERVLPQLGFQIDEILPLRGLMSHTAQEVHRAGRYLSLQGRLPADQAWLMQEWLPRLLHDQDDAVPVEQFTVGYMVRATKRTEAAAGAA